MPSRGTGAFTLSELLIVVGIIAVLAAIPASGLSKARELGRRTKCMGNRRRMIQGIQAFAADHRGYG